MWSCDELLAGEFMVLVTGNSVYMWPSICPLRASRSGLWVSFGGLLAVQPGPAGIDGSLGGGGVVHMGISLWPISYPHAVAQKTSLACLPPCSAAFVKQKVSLSARTGSLTLLVAKTQSSAEEPTVTLPLCRTIDFARTLTRMLSHAADVCAWNKGQLVTVAQMDTCWQVQTCKNMHTWTGAKTCSLIQYTCISICYCLSCHLLCNPSSHRLSHKDTFTHQTQWRTLTHCTLALPVLVFSCLQMERGSRSFFSNLLFFSPLLFPARILDSLREYGCLARVDLCSTGHQ